MQIIIRDVIKDVPVYTVSLGKDPLNPGTTYLFHCIYCQEVISQIQGRVDKIFPGLEPTLDVIMTIKCMNCRRLYTFQSHSYKDISFTRLVLAQLPDVTNILHCYVCRTPLGEFKNQTFYPYPLLKPVVLPSKILCSRPSCQKKYMIVDIL